jgi:hypothetical protein
MWWQRLGRMHQLRLGLDLQGFGRVLLAVSVKGSDAAGFECQRCELERRRSAQLKWHCSQLAIAKILQPCLHESSHVSASLNIGKPRVFASVLMIIVNYMVELSWSSAPALSNASTMLLPAGPLAIAICSGVWPLRSLLDSCSLGRVRNSICKSKSEL